MYRLPWQKRFSGVAGAATASTAKRRSPS
jgi:hypothetical protein